MLRTRAEKSRRPSNEASFVKRKVVCVIGLHGPEADRAGLRPQRKAEGQSMASGVDRMSRAVPALRIAARNCSAGVYGPLRLARDRARLGGFPAEAAPFLYVANEADNTVSVIDTATNTVVGSPIPVGGVPIGVAVTPDGTKVYVANEFSNTVSVIHTATKTVVKTVSVGISPWGTWIRTKIDGVRVPIETLISFAYFANWGKKRTICFNRL